MEEILTPIITIICSVIASSGFWAWMSKHHSKKDATTRMLIGLGHDRIVTLGSTYIERKSITPDEYENLYEYLYKPYVEMGGNGSAEKIMKEVGKLPIVPNN